MISRRIIFVGSLIDMALIFERDEGAGDVDEEVIRELMSHYRRVVRLVPVQGADEEAAAPLLYEAPGGGKA